MAPRKRPNIPTGVWINGAAESDQKVTRNMDGTVTASALIDDANAPQDVRMLVRYSTDRNFSRYYQIVSGWHDAKNKGAIRLTVTMNRLNRNTLYYVRIWAQDRGGLYSTSYNSTSFWTNRKPNPSVLVYPPENQTFEAGSPVAFDWTSSDPDGDTSVAGAALYWRVASTPLMPPGVWQSKVTNGTNATSMVVPNGTFKPSTTYEWQARSKDTQGLWSDFGSSGIRSFTMLGGTTTPLLLSPASNVAVATDEQVTFRWKFRDPLPTSTQGNADFQYRAYGSTVWTTIAGDALTEQEMSFPEMTFTPGFRYEWQVRTYRSTGLDTLSEWSTSGYFWAIFTPGSLATQELPTGEGFQGALGCGTHRVYIYEQGGVLKRGEITSITTIQWGRLRDDISSAIIHVSDFDEDCGKLLGMLRTWRYEVVIYRGEDRVWEGPITHLQYQPNEVTISAKDVLAYMYRRILRQGYNDSWREQVINGVKVQQGMKTVVDRAGLVTINAFSYHDPNVLPYLTLVRTGMDANQGRIVPDYTKSAWEEVDDMAANAGLDYTCVGRRIMFWDTHQHVGVLPEMRDHDFSEPVTVTEYGASASNYFAVTDGQGQWGAAYPVGLNNLTYAQYYGPLEQLASSYGDVAALDPEVMTATERAALKVTLESQAQRNINGRWPAPLVVRVPDNATISPEVNIGINQLIPGVWIPLRAEGTVRKFAQMQKMDSLTVTEDSNGERVAIVMSPAPLSFEDPDASTAIETTE